MSLLKTATNNAINRTTLPLLIMKVCKGGIALGELIVKGVFSLREAVFLAAHNAAYRAKQ